ncbi:AIPR family protein [Streptomonospora algeriensis]|uniref:AIPR family protein n=1 Tax=Streptomonospora algeriensis TaxID=995084 RepID=A0ABW3BAW4_9ACTN
MSDSSPGTAFSTVPRQVEQVRHVLDRDFREHIDLQDVANKPEYEREQQFRSRALAALAVRGITDCTSQEAAARVIDGRDDYGIDAIAVSETSRHVWLIQSKWSDKGKAGFTTADADKLVRGLRQIDQRNFDRFNERMEALEDRIRAVLRGPSQVTLVLALMGRGELSNEVVEIFDDEIEEMNGFGARLDYKVLNARNLWQQVYEEEAPAPVEISTTMRQWVHLANPVEVYQGIVPAKDIAQWTADAEGRLFAENIRESLGLTEVNSGMLETLKSDPEFFLHFNNGITVLCESVETDFPGRRRQDSPVTLTLHGASVVNGAQTVTAIAQGLSDAPEEAEDADVSVHVICTQGGPPDLAKQITRTRNKQNSVEDRDFVAVDPTQALIRYDFSLLLERTYTYRRGEADPGPEAGCSVIQAAVALACAHPNAKLAVRAKQDVNTLWEQGPEGAYSMLFGEQPSAHQIWGSVRLQRAVATELHKLAQSFQGRASDIADRGDLLITHLVFQLIDHQGIEDSTYDWDGVIRRVPDLTKEALARLVQHMDAEFGPESRSSLTRTLADPARCRHLAALVIQDCRTGAAAPQVAEKYHKQRKRRKTRRPNTVPLLMDRDRIAAGTPVVFRPKTVKESAALSTWLAEDPRRAQATWVRDRRFPLLWAYDEQRYSPSGLAMHMFALADWQEAPVAVQGTSRWYVGDQSLTELAEKLFAELGDAEDGEE